ncbi:MAG: Gfo/Idh/MocA family oxidoreductase, partial [Methanomicrobiaceae archaeon]|nr:Gfo/Idh/MocA family oxidoreductase [Methanomicrobiaceae archaeon]
LVSLVACNMRFYHGISKIKELISGGAIGQIYCARVIAGHYLPDWHPELDYRNSYSAKESMGGGVLLDGIHEIDYLCWLLGDVEDLFCFSGKYSQLDIDTEDMAEMLLKFKSGAVGEIHLDYLQRAYGRSCQIIGEKGTILWDFNTKKVSLYSVEKREWQYFDEPEGYDVNQMYIEEMKYFIRCIAGKEKSFNDINEGIRILNIVIAAKESAAEGKLIGTGL